MNKLDYMDLTLSTSLANLGATSNKGYLMLPVGRGVAANVFGLAPGGDAPRVLEVRDVYISEYSGAGDTFFITLSQIKDSLATLSLKNHWVLRQNMVIDYNTFNNNGSTNGLTAAGVAAYASGGSVTRTDLYQVHEVTVPGNDLVKLDMFNGAKYRMDGAYAADEYAGFYLQPAGTTTDFYFQVNFRVYW